MSEPKRRLPIPASFPFEWPDASMEAHFWTWDQVHYPHPLTPLTETFETPAFAQGSTRGFHEVALPINYLVEAINGYAYSAMQLLQPADSFPPPWWGDVEAEFMRRLPVLTQTWENEYLPEVQAANQRLRAPDYTGLSLDALLAFIDETHDSRKRMWDIHMQVVMPVMGAASRFAEMFEQLLGTSGGEPYLLLQGFENKSVESG